MCPIWTPKALRREAAARLEAHSSSNIALAYRPTRHASPQRAPGKVHRARRQSEAVRSATLPAIRPRTPAAGQLIDGNYRVIRTLAVGGMGTVLHAHDLGLQRDVAIKLIRPELLRDVSIREAFVTEARMTARIHHHAVVAIHALGQLDEAPYLVLEYVAGQSLEDFVASQSGSRLELDEALYFLELIADGVDGIHAAGCVHRDLKPANVMVTAGRRIKIVDLGVAQPLRSGSARLAGTPHYMAPEVVSGRAATHATDVYAFGVMCFELLTGGRPYDGPTTLNILKKQLNATPPNAAQRNPALGEQVGIILASGLAKDPSERPRSCTALVQSLKRACSRTDTPAVEAPPERPLPGSRRACMIFRGVEG